MSPISQTCRRFLRFRLRTLLLLPLVFAIGWLWVTRTERTARRFVDLMAAGDVEAAKAMSDLPEPFEAFWAFAAPETVTFDPPVFQKGSWDDYVKGRRAFIIPWKSAAADGELRTFEVVRGRVMLSIANHGNLSIMFSIQHSRAQDMADILSVVNGFRGGNRDIAANATDNSLVVTLPDKQQEQTRYVIEEVERLITAPQSRGSFRHAPFNRTEPLEESPSRTFDESSNMEPQPSGPLRVDMEEMQRQRPR